MKPTRPPDIAHFEAVAAATLDGLPQLYRDWLTDVIIRIEEFASDEVLADMGIDHSYGLLGLYQGRPVGEKSFDISGDLPDMIFLYRQPILALWCEGEDTLEHIIAHVLIHEIGHHFGLSDADMERIEAALD